MAAISGVHVSRSDRSAEITGVAGEMVATQQLAPGQLPASLVPPRLADGSGDCAAPTLAHGPRGKRRASAPLLQDERRYELGRVIGRGGMGEVVAAEDIHIGRDVAIKRLHARTPTDAALARFLREARIQGRLEHPAIPPVYDLAQDASGRPYFAMRMLAGVTLADVLRDPASAFTQHRLLRAFVEVCNAIDLAHSQRVLHRDLKPSNILLGDRGEVYVIDWGIACELDTTDRSAVGVVLGTPGYMAPEQINGELNLDERVDIYALGCILFEILARRPLHPRGNAGIEHALRGEFPDDVQLPFELVNACRRATSKQRGIRFSSARALGEVVQRYLDGDRDLEQRRQLARHHLASARAAFTSPDDDESRRSIVMREAGKALALDPTLAGPAELIGRLMIEAPRTTPAEADLELQAMDLQTSRGMARLSMCSSSLFMLVFAAMIASGVRDSFYLTLFGAVATAMFATALVGQRYPHRPFVYTFVGLMIVMVGVLSRMFTPLLVAPAIAGVVLATLPINPALRDLRSLSVAVVATLAATVGMWIAELAGVLSPTITWQGGHIRLLSPVEGIEAMPATPFLIGTVALSLIMAAAVGYVAMRAVTRARRRIVIQAWHLRQLV